MTDKKLSLDDYKNIVKKYNCRWCGALFDEEPIKHYNHPGGVEVDGFDEKQWLYVTCPQCNYDWTIWKMSLIPSKKSRLEKHLRWDIQMACVEENQS